MWGNINGYVDENINHHSDFNFFVTASLLEDSFTCVFAHILKYLG